MKLLISKILKLGHVGRLLLLLLLRRLHGSLGLGRGTFDVLLVVLLHAARLALLDVVHHVLGDPQQGLGHLRRQNSTTLWTARLQTGGGSCGQLCHLVGA